MPKVNKIESPILDNCRNLIEVNLPPKFVHIKDGLLKRSLANLEEQLKSQQEDEEYQERLKEKEMRKKKKQKDFEM